MTERSIYPNNVEVQQRDLAFTESSKSDQLRERLIDLASGAPGGRGLGLRLEVDPGDTTSVRVTAGRGYTPNGEQVEVLTTSSASGIPLADYTDGVDNFVYALYTETETLPAPQEFGGASRTTRAVGVTTVQSFTQASFDALPDTQTDATLFAKDRALLLGRVVGPNAAGNIAAVISPTEVFPVKGPAEQTQRRFLSVRAFTYTPGVTVTDVLDPATHPRGNGQLRITTTATDPSTRTTTLEYASPGLGDTFGTPVDITGAPTSYIIISDQGERIQVSVRRNLLPQQSYTDTDTVTIVEEMTDDLGTDAVLRNVLYPNATVNPRNNGGVTTVEHLVILPNDGSSLERSPETPLLAFQNVFSDTFTNLMETARSDSASLSKYRQYYGPGSESPTITGAWLTINAAYNNEFDVWTLDDAAENAARIGLRNGQVRIDCQTTSGFADTDWSRMLTAGVNGATLDVVVGGSAPLSSDTFANNASITSLTNTTVRSDASVVLNAPFIDVTATSSAFTLDSLSVLADVDILLNTAQFDVVGGAGGVNIDSTSTIDTSSTLATTLSSDLRVELSTPSVVLNATQSVEFRGGTLGTRFGNNTNFGFDHIYEVLVTASWSATTVNTALAVEDVSSEVPLGAPAFNGTNAVVLGYRALNVIQGTNPVDGLYTSNVLITGSNTLSVVLQAFDSGQSFSAGTWEGEVLIGVRA